MKSSKPTPAPEPKKGQVIYVDSSYHISRGSDDFAGGRATVSKVTQVAERDFPSGEPTGKHRWDIEIAERPGCTYNYTQLLGQQAKVRKEYGKQKARPDPDIDTPWIESGDTVFDSKHPKGYVYQGPPVW